VRLQSFFVNAPQVLDTWNPTHDWSRKKVFDSKSGYALPE
jgi:hypothetical protein